MSSEGFKRQYRQQCAAVPTAGLCPLSFGILLPSCLHLLFHLGLLHLLGSHQGPREEGDKEQYQQCDFTTRINQITLLRLKICFCQLLVLMKGAGAPLYVGKDPIFPAWRKEAQKTQTWGLQIWSQIMKKVGKGGSDLCYHIFWHVQLKLGSHT